MNKHVSYHVASIPILVTMLVCYQQVKLQAGIPSKHSPTFVLQYY
jgi:hypothetical protein